MKRLSRKMNGWTDELDRDHAVILVALYLRGLSRSIEPSKRGWPHVLGRLQRCSATLCEASFALADSGFDIESLLVQDLRLIDCAQRTLDSRRAMTVQCPSYPNRWLERLGPASPPALWWNGVDFDARSSVSIVGSRTISNRSANWVREAARELSSSHFTIISGGAPGCDRVAARGAWQGSTTVHFSPAVELLPYGIGTSAPSQTAQLSVSEWDAEFTTANAMERNALIYAWSPWTIVGHCRSRTGGSWHGAVQALRRRLCRVAVWNDPSNEGAKDLIALGALPAPAPDEIVDWINIASNAPTAIYGPIESRGLWGSALESRAQYAA